MYIMASKFIKKFHDTLMIQLHHYQKMKILMWFFAPINNRWVGSDLVRVIIDANA